MARIKVHDLPKDQRISKEEMKGVLGGLFSLSTEQMYSQDLQTAYNLQYLQLQQQMLNENRQYTMISNIMKIKHDTAMSAINNTR